MKNKEKEIQLKEKLTMLIKNYGHNTSIKKLIGIEFKRRNIKTSEVRRSTWVCDGNYPLINLTDEEDDIRFLFLFTYEFSKALESEENEILNVEDYFTKIEIDRWSNYSEEEVQKDIYPKVFEKVVAIGFKINTWQGYLSAKEIDELETENLIIYNPKTQRNPTITVNGIKITTFPIKRDQIADRLLSGEQYPDPIILNIVGERPIYNAQKGTLTLNKDSRIEIIDGQNRKIGVMMAMELNPKLDFIYPITFTFLPEHKAQDFIAQKNKQTEIKAEYESQFDYEKKENKVVNAIFNEDLSELAKVTKDDNNYIRINRALTKKIIIAEAVKDNYNDELETSININSVGKWIVKVTDYLMGTYIEEFIRKPYEIKQHSFINHKNMFYGYIALSSALYNHKDDKNEDEWQLLLKQKMESIDFNRSNKMWKDLGMINDIDASKTLRNNLYELFKGGIL